MSDTLAAISSRTNTDKKPSEHNYVSFYERYFEDIRNDVKTVVEIGCGGGGSLKTWKEYFPNAQIWGIDIRPEVDEFVEDRINVLVGDQGDKEFMLDCMEKIGEIDVLIEDGSHVQHHQQQNLAWLFPYVKSGGFFVIEDLYFSYLEWRNERERKRIGENGEYSHLNPDAPDTLTIINDFIETGKFRSEFVTPEEEKYLEENTLWCRLAHGRPRECSGAAECSIHKKK